MTRKFGFTLAEVLITLGIIGVVAAMTMPTLLNQTNGAQYKAAYKKALSAISQGVTLNVALDGIDFSEAKAGAAGATTTANSVANILATRMNVVNAKTGDAVGYTIDENGSGLLQANSNTQIFFNDGSSFGFVTNDTACTETKPCKGYIDVNGMRGPNRVISDANNPTDVYPVRFYDQTILPNSAAAREVLYGK